MKILIGGAAILLLAGGFFLFASPRVAVFDGNAAANGSSTPQTVLQKALSILKADEPASNIPAPHSENASADIENQRPLASPPEVAKAIYLTGWSAGSESKLASSMDLIQKRGLNAVIIDIKDYSGYVSYRMDVPGVKATGAENEIRILKPNTVVKKLHDKNIYVIGRVTVFQDPILAKAHPEWALKNKNTGKLWLDNHGLAWLDPAGSSTWDYVISIAKDALNRGFDEINFDYIRFASDGNLDAIQYPFWQKTRTDADLTRTDAETKREVIRGFFKYLRKNLPDAKISADLFGLATIDTWDDLGIGQVIEDAYRYFDYVSPMVYPSHYAAGTLGYKNPAQHPYEIVRYSMDAALKRLITYNQKLITATSSANESSVIGHRSSVKLRPWLQAFDLGAVYTPAMINEQIKAVTDAFSNNSSTNNSITNTQITDYYGGWLLWDPTNKYSSYRG
ncbi:MAG: hypothetical protein HY433_03235 [Candidatus Liptonbacteria bacterium]|nr:hypothetical protein [Candidatus Liptonbacteria bacterium]